MIQILFVFTPTREASSHQAYECLSFIPWEFKEGEGSFMVRI